MILINEYGNEEQYRSLVVLNLRELYANSRTVTTGAESSVCRCRPPRCILQFSISSIYRCILCLHERKNHRIPPARQLLAHTRTQSHCTVAY
jgi:hypothetical protein